MIERLFIFSISVWRQKPGQPCPCSRLPPAWTSPDLDFSPCTRWAHREVASWIFFFFQCWLKYVPEAKAQPAGTRWWALPWGLALGGCPGFTNAGKVFSFTWTFFIIKVFESTLLLFLPWGQIAVGDSAGVNALDCRALRMMAYSVPSITLKSSLSFSYFWVFHFVCQYHCYILYIIYFTHRVEFDIYLNKILLYVMEFMGFLESCMFL